MLTLAIQNIRPGSNWYLEGETYDKLVWTDTEKTKPTEQEINDEIIRIKELAQNTRYQFLRAKEYPPIEDYLDGIVKGDQQQIQAYINACLEIKAKYPKPGV
jgi:hypothetical protein